MLAFFLIAILVLWIALAIGINLYVFKRTAQSSRWAKAIYRALSLTLTWGIGGIGGEGFGLPGPLLGALIFYNGPKYYPYTALIPALAWFILFFAVTAVSGSKSRGVFDFPSSDHVPETNDERDPIPETVQKRSSSENDA